MVGALAHDDHINVHLSVHLLIMNLIDLLLSLLLQIIIQLTHADRATLLITNLSMLLLFLFLDLLQELRYCDLHPVGDTGTLALVVLREELRNEERRHVGVKLVACALLLDDGFGLGLVLFLFILHGDIGFRGVVSHHLRELRTVLTRKGLVLGYLQHVLGVQLPLLGWMLGQDG